MYMHITMTVLMSVCPTMHEFRILILGRRALLKPYQTSLKK